MPNLLRRNPNYPKPFGNAANIAYREKLFPARVTPGVNRGGEGDIDEKGYLKASTASCGPVMYRGDQFPPEWRDTAFFCEPAANLVRVIKVDEKDGLLSGSLPLEEREFLASTDERFRPVNLFNAPDGSLFVVDLYHGIVQHKAYLTRYLREHIEHRNLESDPRLGRIYRIKAKGRPLGEVPKMSGKKAVELVPYLADENGWSRDTAQQLIIDSGDLSVIDALNVMAGNHEQPLGQIHALWTLEGLGAVNLDAVSAAMRSENTHVLEMAIRLSENLPAADVAVLLPVMDGLADRPELVVRRQLAASLGRLPGDEALLLLKKVLTENIDQPYFREVAINGLAGKEMLFQKILGDDFKDADFTGYLTESLRPKTNAAAFKLPRDKPHKASFKRGEKLFVSYCMACHGADGMGLEQLGPPLAGSEWVTGSHKRLAAILLQGMRGPIRVAGKVYNPAAAMPGLKDNTELSDQNLADIATFTRFAWNNGKDPVHAETFNQVRGELEDRETSFTPEEVEKLYP